MRRIIKLSILMLARSLGLFGLSRWLTRWDLRILCYHGGAIGDESEYNPKLFMSGASLAKRMQWLQRTGFHVVPLDIVSDTNLARTTPLRTIITFDDGWHSTGSELLPVLEAIQAPSTLYLCTQHYNEGWPVLSVAVRYTLWKSSRNKVDLASLYPQLVGTHDIATQAGRNMLSRKIVPLIEQSCTNREEVCAALGSLAEAVGVSSEQLDLDSRRFDYMSPHALRGAAGRGCSIELHGHVHDYPQGKPVQFREDLEQCSQVITDLGLPKPRHYCYPSGSYDAGASPVLSDLRLVSATTCKPGLVRRRSKHHYLPRFLDGGNVHQLEFEAELSGFSDLVRRALATLSGALRRPVGATAVGAAR